jgi:peptide/nickel transport system substrate-binding protein
MKRLLLIPALVAFSMALILLGAHQSPAAPAPTKPTPQYGGILKIIWSRTPVAFGYPPEIAGVASLCIYPALEGLLDFDSAMRFQPTKLVTALAVAPDGKSITFTLRKGVQFHDGTDFNAQAVKWNLDRELQAKQLGTESWNSIEATDNYTVRIHLKQYDSAFPTLLARTLGMQISPTAVERNGLEWARNHPVGTGPFKFKSYERDVSLKFERFDGYWGGRPYLDGIEYLFLKDHMVQEAAFRAGEAQMLMGATAKQASDLKKMGYTVRAEMTTLDVILPDSGNPNSALANKKVREALEHAIDRRALADGLGYGYWRGASQPAIPEFPIGYNPDIKGREYNPTRAKQLLAEAGYPNGFKTRLIIDSTLGFTDAMVAIQRYWKDVGVDAEVESVPRIKYEEHRAKGWHDGFVNTAMGCDPLYVNTLERFLSTKGKIFVSTLRPTGLDKGFNDVRAAMDPESMARTTRRLARMIHDEAALLPLWSLTDLAFVLDKSVHDTGYYDRYHYHLWNPEKAWLSK